MAVQTQHRPAQAPVERHGVDVGVPAVRNPAFDAYLLLRMGFVIAPILFGLDKFFDWMVRWESYLWPEVSESLDLSAGTIMNIVGGVEIAAGLIVLLAPRIGSLLVAGWLGAVIVNLVAFTVDVENTEFWDIALRDFGLMLGAIALSCCRMPTPASAGARTRQSRDHRSPESATGPSLRTGLGTDETATV